MVGKVVSSMLSYVAMLPHKNTVAVFWECRSVNNGIHVQTGVGHLYPESRIQYSPSTTTYEILARSLVFKPRLP